MNVNMKENENKTLTVLVTGANRGIGLALTRHYLSQGHKVFCTCREEHRESLLTVLARHVDTSKLNIVSVDLAEPVRESAFAAVADNSLDLLINNAAMGDAGAEFKYETMQSEAWLQAFRVNVIAPLDLTRVLLPKFSPSGTAVMISSHLASISLNDSPDSVLYGATKAALNSAVHRLSLSPLFFDISLGLIHPSSVQTRLSGFNGMSPDHSAALIAQTCHRFIKRELTSGSFVDARSGELLPW